MGKLNGTLFVTILMMLTALALSGVAAWFSVVGLMAIFAASPFSIAVMAGTLEVAKLVCASWVYNHWHIVPRLIKAYLTAAVVVLMFITSMGIFGYLSKAHLDQGVPTGEVAAKVQLIDEKIQIQQDNLKVQRDNIAAARTALSQLDAQVGATLDRTTTAAGADRSVSIRRQQNTERRGLQSDIAKAQTEIEKINAEIAKLREQRAPIATELRKVEAEVGPIKYIAALIYGDEVQDDVTTLEKAVRWVTILLVIVFDPLAVIMLIAANFGMRNFKNKPDDLEAIEEKIKEVEEESAKLKEELEAEKNKTVPEEVDQWNKMLEAAEAEALREIENRRREETLDPVVSPTYPSNEEELEELLEAQAQAQAKPEPVTTKEPAQPAYTYQELGSDYININGKTFSKPVYENLKATGQLEKELADAVLSIAPIEGISLERVKDLINKMERGELTVDDLTLPEREAVRKFLET